MILSHSFTQCSAILFLGNQGLQRGRGRGREGKGRERLKAEKNKEEKKGEGEGKEKGHLLFTKLVNLILRPKVNMDEVVNGLDGDWQSMSSKDSISF